jgi:hypothetical protein
VTNLNNLIKGTEFESASLEDIIRNITGRRRVQQRRAGLEPHVLLELPEARTAAVEPAGALADAIKAKFGSFDAFKEAFTKSAVGQFRLRLDLAGQEGRRQRRDRQHLQCRHPADHRRRQAAADHRRLGARLLRRLPQRPAEVRRVEPCDLVVAYYTVQFIRPRFRQPLFDRVFEALNWGGAFVLFEKVRGPDARFQDMLTALYDDYKREQGYDDREIMGKARSLRGVLEPYTSQANVDYLRRAGFSDVMPVMKYLGFEGILAIK